MNTYINKKTGAVVTVNSEISGDWELDTPNPVDEVSSAQLDEQPPEDKTSAEDVDNTPEGNVSAEDLNNTPEDEPPADEKPKRTGKKKD